MTYLEAGNYDIELIARNQFLCSDTIRKKFTAYEEPIAQFTVLDSIGCEPFTVTFDNQSLYSEYAIWISDQKIDTNFHAQFTYPDTGVYDVTLVVGNGSGCTDSITRSQFIEVFPSPIADFTFDKIDNALPTTYQFTDQSGEDAVDYWWDFGDGTISEEENPRHRYLSSYDKEVIHIVYNEYECPDTANAIINLDTLTGLFIPNAVEPDNTINELKGLFKPQGIGLAEYHIAVFARNGQLVWESSKLDAEGIPEESWDGTLNGKPLPSGVYIWEVKRAKFLDGTNWDGMEDDNGKPRKSGFIYLIR